MSSTNYTPQSTVSTDYDPQNTVSTFWGDEDSNPSVGELFLQSGDTLLLQNNFALDLQ